jgi:hypothetical protein
MRLWRTKRWMKNQRKRQQTKMGLMKRMNNT